MTFNMRLLKNKRWWICLPYTLAIAVIVFPILSLLLLMSKIGLFLIWICEKANNHPADVFYMRAVTKWIRGGFKK